MRLAIIVLILFVSFTSYAQDKSKKAAYDVELKEGDLIFQQTGSDFSKAIQLATGSKYSHVGMIIWKDREWQVLEALQPVRFTPLDKFIENGIKGHYVIKRWTADSLINDSTLQIMYNHAKSMLGKDYDNVFNWSDDRIYCSELVWKIYHRTFGVEIGKLQPLQTFDLSHPLVKRQLEANYGKSLPLQEPIISPIAMFNSDLLITIKESP